MRTLHLPVNIASQVSTTIRGLREAGWPAEGLCHSARIQDCRGVRVLTTDRPKGAAGRARYLARAFPAVIRAIAAADLVHWYSGPALPGALDLQWAKMLGKPGVVEFWGSDIRRPALECRRNPNFAELWNSGRYEYQSCESEAGSVRLQARFARLGFAALVPSPSLEDYLDKAVFGRWFRTRQRIPLEDYPLNLPDPEVRRPLVVHMPSARHTKGTAHVLAAVDEVRKDADFEFLLIENMPRAAAAAELARADVLVDQLNYGDYGLAAVEGMASGKPVICYLHDDVRRRLPAALPIVSAGPGDLAAALKRLVSSGPLRRRLGEEGRAYVEAHHSAQAWAGRLMEIYRQITVSCGNHVPAPSQAGL